MTKMNTAKCYYTYLIVFFLILVLQLLKLSLISAVFCQYIHNLCLVFSWEIKSLRKISVEPNQILRCLKNARELRKLILKFYFKFIAMSQIQSLINKDSDKQSKWFTSILRFEGKI